MRGDDSGNVSADAKEGGLRKRHRASMTEDELEAEHKQYIDAAQRQNPHIIGVSKKRRIDNERDGRKNQREPNAGEKPGEQSRHPPSDQARR